MMKLTKNKICIGLIIVTLITTLLLLTIDVFATNTNDIVINKNNAIIDGKDNTENTTNNNANANTNKPTNTAKNTVGNSNNTNRTTVYQDTNLPKTGLESFSFIIIIGVCIISAIYAFKKIREYRM